MSEDGVDVSRGRQRLNGEQALVVVRSRRVYSNSTVGRDNTQQEFMKAVATQLINNRRNLNVTTLVNVFLRDVRTNIQLNHLVWFGERFMRMNVDNINFSTMPGAIDSVGVQSYVTILVDDWLKVINEKLNPFDRDIVYEDLSILTRNSERRLYVTNGVWEGDPDWGRNSLGPVNPSLTTDRTRIIPGGVSR